jgi:medium-chain acyl-[acyl-carrier-protein] hydrolase
LNGWVVHPRAVLLPRVRLICFPHGGGSASTFNYWPRELPEDVEVCAIQLPGRGRRLFEAPPASIHQIIEALLDAFNPFRTPIALFGHSFGALVAFEFARQLQSKTIPPVHLFVSGQFAPQLPHPDFPIRDLPDREFIAEVRLRYKGLPEEILRDDKMMGLLLPALRADFTMKETYQYVEGPRLGCPISALGGCQDRSVTTTDLVAWCDQTYRAFNFKMFPGGHFFVESARESVVRSIAADLEHSLRENFCETSPRASL